MRNCQNCLIAWSQRIVMFLFRPRKNIAADSRPGQMRKTHSLPCDDLRGGDELTRQGQDGVAQTVQPLFLVPPQLNRMSTNKATILRKKTNGGCGGGGGDYLDDDPDDGRRGNNQRDKDENSDDEGSQGGRKKEGRTADYLDSIKKKPAMVSPAKLLALAGTPAGFAPAGYFPYGGTSWHANQHQP